MNCLKCIKRLFFGKETKEEEEDFIEYNYPVKVISKNQESYNNNTPLTINGLSDTSMFRAINEWTMNE